VSRAEIAPDEEKEGGSPEGKEEEGTQIVKCPAGIEAGRREPGQPGWMEMPPPAGVESEGSPLDPVYEPTGWSGETEQGSPGAKRIVEWMEKGPLSWGPKQVLPYDEKRESAMHFHPG
jgi:hypothetical protein